MNVDRRRPSATMSAAPAARARPPHRLVATSMAVAVAAIAVFAGPPAIGRAQDDAADGLTAAIEAAPASATVGDRIAFDVRVAHPAGSTVVWPELTGPWGPFEILGAGPRRTDGGGTAAGAAAGATSPSAAIVEHRVLTATAFTTGTLRTPALALTVVDASGVARTVLAAPARVTIRAVVDPNDAAPRGPHGPVALPMPSRWPLLAGALGLAAALVTLLVWSLRRLLARRTGDVPASEPGLDFRTPFDLATEALRDLSAADLPARGRVVEHYTLLADTLRQFVERAYHLPALERTTPELAGAFGAFGERDAEVEPLLAVLGDADLVKFARIVPDAPTARASLADARALLAPLWGAAERRRIAAEAAAAKASRLGEETATDADAPFPDRATEATDAAPEAPIEVAPDDAFDRPPAGAPDDEPDRAPDGTSDDEAAA